MMGGKAPMALAIMWSSAAITSILVILRLYMRIFIQPGFGFDDHAYWLSGVLQLLYTVYMTISAQHGFGQPMPSPNALSSELDAAALAIKLEMIGQTFAVIGMAVAKLSLGFSLLRIVVARWQKILIGAVMSSLSAVSALTAIMFWAQCKPVTKIFDPTRVPGVCDIDVTPFAIMLGVCCVIVDFFFAIFPWFIVMPLQMKKYKKLLIAGSLSLGLITGACGIVRTYEVATGFTENYLLDTVPLNIWSAAELTVTLLCIAIPFLRPLWCRSARRSEPYSDGSHQKQGGEGAVQVYKMSDMPRNTSVDGNNWDVTGTYPELGVREQCSSGWKTGDNRSDELILGIEQHDS